MSEYRIAIVNSSSFGRRFPFQMERLKKIGEVVRFTVDGTMHGKELAEKLQGYNLIISSVTPVFDKEFFENKDELYLISRHGIGYNNIDLKAAKEHGTFVSIVPPLVERDAVAENAVANLMALMRMTTKANQAANEGRWKERATFVGKGITGKTVGIIGCGNIGSRVAEILKHGFNTKVLVTDPKLNQEWAKIHGVEQVSLETLVKESDIISLNCTLNETSYHILNEKTIGMMKKGVYVTNTARGALIDETAMCKAIEDGIVEGLATDVMCEEPAEITHPYFKYDNILITPHTSAYTIECLEGMGEKCVDDLEKVVSGQIPKYCVEA